MSAAGHARRSGRVPPTSAPPPSTDIVMPARQVRFVPEPDLCAASQWTLVSHASVPGFHQPAGLFAPLFGM